MLRNAQLMTTLTATLFTLSLGLPALAKTSYPNHIPNGGVNSCATCHVSPYGGGTRTAFGNDVRSTLSGGLPDWSALYALDSDGDGQSNGEELGDPCGDWTFGNTPARQTDISAPGDSDDLSADPQTPACGDQSDVIRCLRPN